MAASCGRFITAPITFDPLHPAPPDARETTIKKQINKSRYVDLFLFFAVLSLDSGQ